MCVCVCVCVCARVCVWHCSDMGWKGEDNAIVTVTHNWWQLHDIVFILQTDKVSLQKGNSSRLAGDWPDNATCTTTHRWAIRLRWRRVRLPRDSDATDRGRQTNRWFGILLESLVVSLRSPAVRRMWCTTSLLLRRAHFSSQTPRWDSHLSSRWFCCRRCCRSMCRSRKPCCPHRRTLLCSQTDNYTHTHTHTHSNTVTQL